MEQFIDPKTFSRVKDLPLVAKTIAQGFLHGMHTSKQRGVGVEFSQYRLYEPGDELAKIDWKLFARSDRYFVREAERESEINVWLILDASHSMTHSSYVDSTFMDSTSIDSKSGEAGLSKLDYARYLLTTIAYLAQKQGDAVGFLGMSSKQHCYVPAYSGERHWQKLTLQIAQVESGGVFPNTQQLLTQINSMRKTGLIFVVSDFYQKNNEITEFVCQLANSKTEVVAVQLESNDEVEFPFSGAIRFEDLETKQQILVSGKQAKADYLAAKEHFQQSLSKQFIENKIQHFRANIDKPLDQTLVNFLSVRQKVG